MDRFDGTAARQLNLIAEDALEASRPRVRHNLKLLKEDVYVEILRRRRRAQIAARRALAEAGHIN